MELRTLGRTGVKVSPLCLGAMMFGAWGNADHEDSVRIIHRALDAGINFIDTADVYARGESEEIVGRALAGGRRDDVVLATKFHGAMGEDPNHRGNSRRWIIREVEESLRRLRTDWIDLYQVHRPEPTPTSRRRSRRSPTSSAPARSATSAARPSRPRQLVEAQWVSRERRLERFATEQPPYSILVRGVEADVLPTCARHGIAVIPVEPARRRLAVRRLPQGRRAAELARAATASPAATTSPRPTTSAKLEAADALAVLAEEAGLSLIELAIAWVINHPAVTAAIIGPRTMEHLESMLAGGRRRRSTAPLLDRIDEIVPPGVNVNPADAGFENPALSASAQRR